MGEIFCIWSGVSLSSTRNAFLHMLRHGIWSHVREKGLVHVDGAEKPAGGAGEKDQHEGKNQFPAQRLVHSPRLFWIAVSAIAYSVGRSLLEIDVR